MGQSAEFLFSLDSRIFMCYVLSYDSGKSRKKNKKQKKEITK